MTERVMIDIETLGTDPGAAVLSIGAVTFGAGGIEEEFYREIDVESCQNHGLELDANTLKWWMKQDEEVQSVLQGGDALDDVLENFKEFVPSDAEVWANSPSFDCAILETAFDAIGVTKPWSYSDTRDVRTLRSLPVAQDVERQKGFEDKEHHALHDARYQAEIVSITLQSM